MSTRRIILDTDVASLSIKNALPPALLRELLGAQVGITFVTVGELRRWALLRNWGPPKVTGLEAWLSTRPTLPYNDAVARKWGEISVLVAAPEITLRPVGTRQLVAGGSR